MRKMLRNLLGKPWKLSGVQKDHNNLHLPQWWVGKTVTQKKRRKRPRSRLRRRKMRIKVRRRKGKRTRKEARKEMMVMQTRAGWSRLRRRRKRKTMTRWLSWSRQSSRRKKNTNRWVYYRESTTQTQCLHWRAQTSTLNEKWRVYLRKQSVAINNKIWVRKRRRK